MRGVVSFLFVLVSCQFGWSQQGPPPPMAMASEENQKLIDELIEVTHIKEQYLEICTSFIEQAAIEKGWDATEIKRRKQKTGNIDQFIRSSFYSSMAFLSSDELREAIKFFKKANKKNLFDPYFISCSVITHNFLMYVNALIE